MNLKQRNLTFVLIFVLIAALAIGASGALAQTGDVTPTPAPSQYNWTMPGMMWNNWQDAPMWTTVADALGIDAETLRTELQNGTTLAQLAEQKGVDIQTVYDAMQTVMTDHMNAMVQAGYMTQAQADTQLTWMHDNMSTMPMFSGQGMGMGMHMGGCGMGNMGMMNSGHMGMMGNGMMGGGHMGMMGMGSMHGHGY